MNPSQKKQPVSTFMYFPQAALESPNTCSDCTHKQKYYIAKVLIVVNIINIFNILTNFVEIHYKIYLFE